MPLGLKIDVVLASNSATTMKKLLYVLAIGLVLNGCVPKRKLHAAQADAGALRADSTQQASRIAHQEADINQLNSQVQELNKKLTDLQNRSGLTEDQLNQSKEQIAEQRRRLAQLQALMDQQKNAIQDIRKKMSDALVGFNSKDLSVSIKNGKVYVSLSENLLFPSGSAVVNPKGKEALGKLATVLNTNPDITVDIEGHTDSVPIHGRYPDNWALSVARSTAIVRILTTDYLVDPVRVIASGHSSYDPVQTNSTPEGRALNRRTEIILSPRLDELYKLLESTPDSTAKIGTEQLPSHT
jgi:chemotaxis protein MotB